MKRAINLKRLKPGYYYTPKPVRIQDTETHVVIEETDSKAFWILRLEDMPGWETLHCTKAGAKAALRMLIDGSLEPVLA